MQVRAAYYRFAGNEDVSAFMKSIGFSGFTSTLASHTSVQDDFRRAIQATNEVLSGPQSAQQPLAESANARLKDWQADYYGHG